MFVARQVFKPVNNAKDVGIDCKIAFPDGHSEKAAAFFIPHRSFEPPNEKCQLFA